MGDKIDTQGMSIPSSVKRNTKKEYSPMPVRKCHIFSDLERNEIKQIIFEALDEYGTTRNS